MMLELFVALTHFLISQLRWENKKVTTVSYIHVQTFGHPLLEASNLANFFPWCFWAHILFICLCLHIGYILEIFHNPSIPNLFPHNIKQYLCIEIKIVLWLFSLRNSTIYGIWTICCQRFCICIQAVHPKTQHANELNCINN